MLVAAVAAALPAIRVAGAALAVRACKVTMTRVTVTSVLAAWLFGHRVPVHGDLSAGSQAESNNNAGTKQPGRLVTVFRNMVTSVLVVAAGVVIAAALLCCQLEGQVQCHWGQGISPRAIFPKSVIAMPLPYRSARRRAFWA